MTHKQEIEFFEDGKIIQSIVTGERRIMRLNKQNCSYFADEKTGKVMPWPRRTRSWRVVAKEITNK